MEEINWIEDMGKSSLNVVTDAKEMAQAKKIAESMEMTLPGLVAIFVRRLANEGTMPFEVGEREMEAEDFSQLLISMRAKAAARGFMSEEEINAIIYDVRRERAAKKAQQVQYA